MQHKVFRIEQTAAAARRAAPAPDPAAKHPDIGERATPDAALEHQGGAGDAALKRELIRVHDLIARHRRELGAFLDEGKQERRMTRAAGELGAAVEGTEKATQSILKSAEGIDDSAKALAAALKTTYELGLAQDIQEHVVRIYEACNFQDLVGQRIGKVITMLGTLELELAAMLARCAGAEISAAIPTARAADRDLISGPKLDGETGHASQRDIDKMFS